MFSQVSYFFHNTVDCNIKVILMKQFGITEANVISVMHYNAIFFFCGVSSWLTQCASTFSDSEQKPCLNSKIIFGLRGFGFIIFNIKKISYIVNHKIGTKWHTTLQQNGTNFLIKMNRKNGLPKFLTSAQSSVRVHFLFRAFLTCNTLIIIIPLNNGATRNKSWIYDQSWVRILHHIRSGMYNWETQSR